MGDHVAALAVQIADLAGLPVPLHPFFVARVTGLSLFAAQGMAAPVMLVGVALYFDDEVPGWRRELALVVCGHALRWQGLTDTLEARRDLARELGISLAVEEREPAPARESQILIH